MPRAQLTPLPSYPFACELAVRVTDLNYGGHLAHDRLLSLLHEARVAFLAARGWSEPDCGGVALILGDAVIVYQGEAFAGDRLKIEVGVAETGRAGFRLAYRVTRADAPIALAETGLVGFDYAARRVAPLPAPVRDTLEGMRHD